MVEIDKQTEKVEIDKQTEKWRGSLDVLLEFIGLFSAIVTAFLIESLGNLKPDEAVRTNELLANLTDIVIKISGANVASLNVTAPAVFESDPNHVLLNVYWSLSLIISISIAILPLPAGRLSLASRSPAIPAR